MTAAANNDPIGLTVLEVAAQLRCSDSKVFRLLKAGDLQRIENAPGRETLITPESLAAYRRMLNPAAPRIPTPRPEPKRTAPTAADLQRRRQAIDARRAALTGRMGAAASPGRKA